VSEPFRALDWQLQGMTQTGAQTYGTAEEWRLVAQRMAAVPRFLETARRQLHRRRERQVMCPTTACCSGTDSTTSEANAKYFAAGSLAGDRGRSDVRTDTRRCMLTQIRAASAAMRRGVREVP
jgi:hypothetical protein